MTSEDCVESMTSFVFFLMQFDTDMNQALLARSDLYLHAMRKQFPLRDIKTEVVNINGKLVFITSYFKKLEPPRELCQGTDIEQMVRAKLSLFYGKSLNVLRDFIFLFQRRVARFVSLIPFVSDTVFFANSVDIWSTCDVRTADVTRVCAV